jgi:hypothetical protein
MALIAHATLGASGAHRWIPCPGSIRMSRGMPNEGSVFAREGSAAHEIGELVLKNQLDRIAVDQPPDTMAIDYLGYVVPDYPEIVIDESVCSAVQEYIDCVWGEIDKYEAAGHSDWELGVEVRFDLTHVYPDMFGTCDAVLFLPAFKRLIVFDYKHGWVSVPVERNPQTMYYAIGAVSGKHNRDVETIELAIVQPRTGRHTPVKRWECDREELEDFKYVLIDSAKRTEGPTSKLNPGEWCKFCPASPTCKALTKRIMEMIMATNDPIDGLTIPDPDKIPFEQLKPIWDNVDMIASWAKNFKAYCHQLAVKEDKLLPGTKLVEGKAYRYWPDEEKAEKELEALVDMGELDGEIFVTKLKSPAQIEDMLPKKFKGIIKGMWKKGRGALTLVADKDDRGSAKADAFKEF